MALIFKDGFDYYDTAAYLALIWDANPNSRAPQSTSSGRFSGSRSVSLNNGDSIYKNVAAQQTYIAAFAIKLTSLPGSSGTIVQFLDGSTVHCDLRISSAGLLSITRNGTQLGVAASGLVTNIWYHLQVKIKIDDSTGTFECRVDGVTGSAQGVTAGTGADTRNGGAATVSRITFGGASASFNLDDVIILDTTGALNNDFPGDCKITTVFPSGAGATNDFSSSGGGGSSSGNVDENPPNDDTDYNFSSNVGDIDLYAIPDLTVTGAILAVKATLIHRKDDAGTRQIAGVARSGGTNYVGSTKTCSSSFKPDSEIYETDPDTGLAWTESGFNAAQFGAKVIA